MCSRVLDACMSRLLRALPQLRELNPDAPIVLRMDACAALAGVRRDELLSWAIVLNDNCTPMKPPNPILHQENKQATPPSDALNDKAIIRELLVTNRLLAARVSALEARSPFPSGTACVPDPANTAPSTTFVKKPRCKGPAAHLAMIWYEWYAGEPRLWCSSDPKKRSDAKHNVAFMKLFVTNGFHLDPSSLTYRDDVMALG